MNDLAIKEIIRSKEEKRILTGKREILLNVDDILRIPLNKLLVNIRGNRLLLLDKVMYKEHPLARKLKDSPISEYNPKWTKNTTNNVPIKEKSIEKPVKKKEKLGWNNF